MSDVVYTSVDFFDRPLTGAANFEGRPHWYKCEFNEAADDYEEFYRLALLPDDVLSAEVERQGIFLMWHAALKAGQTDRSTHPALPEHQARHEELNRIVSEFVERAEFVAEAKAVWSLQGGSFCVDWTRLGR